MDDRTDQLPQQYTPLSPWAYFGYSILFAIPIVGIILLFIFSFNNNNINRRNYARSYFCFYVLAIIAIIVCVALGVSIPTNN